MQEPNVPCPIRSQHLHALVVLAVLLPAASVLGLAQSPSPRDEASQRRRASAVRVLANAEAEAAAFDEPMRCGALLWIGQVYLAVDRVKAAKLLEEVYQVAVALPANDPPGMREIVRSSVSRMAKAAPEKMRENMPADPELRRIAMRSLMNYYIGRKELQRAQEIYRAMDDSSAQFAAEDLLKAIPKSSSLERNAVFSQAIAAFRRADTGFALGSTGLPAMLVRDWRELDPRLVEYAIDVFLGKAKEAIKSDKEFSAPSIIATAGNENIRFASPYEFRLFQLLPMLRELNPGRAEALLREEQNLSAVMASFPQGPASLSASGDVYYRMSYSRQPPARVLSDQQRLAGNVARLVSLSRSDPMTAIAQSIALPEAERGEALVTIARAHLGGESRSVAEKTMSAYLKLRADRTLSATTAYRGVENFLELKDKPSAESALDMLLKVIEFDYRQDSDPTDPNIALKLNWGSTLEWAGATRLASKISQQAVAKVVREIPDPEIRVLAQIEWAAALLNLPPNGGGRLTIHKNK